MNREKERGEEVNKEMKKNGKRVRREGRERWRD